MGILLNEKLGTDAAIKEALDRFSLAPVDQVRTLLHWKLYAFRDRDRFDLARVMLTPSEHIPPKFITEPARLICHVRSRDGPAQGLATLAFEADHAPR